MMNLSELTAELARLGAQDKTLVDELRQLGRQRGQIEREIAAAEASGSVEEAVALAARRPVIGRMLGDVAEHRRALVPKVQQLKTEQATLERQILVADRRHFDADRRRRGYLGAAAQAESQMLQYRALAAEAEQQASAAATELASLRGGAPAAPSASALAALAA